MQIGGYMFMKKMNKRGVTLIELVVVMIIIAIGAALLVPNISAWLPKYRLRSATRDIVSMMRTAQMKAVSTNIVYGVAFDPGSIQLYRSSGGLIPEGSSINVPKGIQFDNNTFPINATLNKPFAQFNTNSTCSPGGVTVQAIKGVKILGEKRITLTTATGKVRIE